MLDGMKRRGLAATAALLALALAALPALAGAAERDEAPLRPLRVDLRPLYGAQAPRGLRAQDVERARPRGRFLPAFVFLAAPVPPPALSRAEPVRDARRLDDQKSPGRHKASTPAAL